MPTLKNNMAWDAMQVLGGWTFGPIGGATKEGEDISKEQVKMQETYTTKEHGTPSFTLDWDFTGIESNTPVWKWGSTSYPLPVLYWQTSQPELPTHLN
jgi:hypothetical protein